MMSTLLGNGVPEASTRPDEVPPSVVGSSLLAAVQAAAASLVVVLLPVVGTWVTAVGGSAIWTDVVRLALDLWVLAQHGGIVVADGHVGLVPLGLSAAPLIACWFAGRRLARVLDPRSERIAAGTSRARPAFPPLRALVIFASVYALIAALAAALGATSWARPIPGQAFAGAGVIATVAGGLGACAYRFGSARTGLGALIQRLLPVRVRRWLKPAAAVLGLQLTASFILLVSLLIGHRDQVLALHRALQPDLTGGVVLVIAQLALLPNLLLWAACVVAGPGFGIGAGTSVTASAVVLGPLPALPVLGALPNPGPLPAAAGVLLCVPVLAGAVAGTMLLRSGVVFGRQFLIDVLGVAVVVAVVFTGLAWLSGGPAGPGRLAVTGPVPWQAGAALGTETMLGGLLAVLTGRGAPTAGRWVLGRLRGNLADRRDGAGDDDHPPPSR
jgi:hypothetical protein